MCRLVSRAANYGLIASDGTTTIVRERFPIRARDAVFIRTSLKQLIVRVPGGSATELLPPDSELIVKAEVVIEEDSEEGLRWRLVSMFVEGNCTERHKRSTE